MRAVTPSENARTAGTQNIDGQVLYSSTSRGYQEFISGNEWNQRYGYDLNDRARNSYYSYTEEDIILDPVNNEAYIRSQSNPEVMNNGQVYNRFHKVTLFERNGDQYLRCTCEYFNRDQICKHTILISNIIE